MKLKITGFLFGLIFALGLASFLPAQSAQAGKDFSSFSVSEIFTESSGETSEKSLVQRLITRSNESAEISSPIMAFILIIINILSLLIGTFAFIMILIGGFIFVTSGGEEGQVDKGKAILKQSIAGLIIAFMSYTIVWFIQSFFYN